MRPGDIIIKPINNLFYHAGIYAGNGQIIHQIQLSQNKTIIKLENIHIAEFSVVDTIQHNLSVTLDKALQHIGEISQYNIFFNNCWHFVSECAFGDRNAIKIIEWVRESLEL